MPRKDSPKKSILNAISELNKISPIKKITDISYVKISEWILKEENIKISPDSVRKWIKRNPKPVEKLLDKINSKDEEDVTVINIQKIESTEKQQNINQKQKTVGISRAPALNRVKPFSKDKLMKIKFNLHEDFKGYRDAIKYVLDNYYIWTEYNIKETREYLKTIEENININKEYEYCIEKCKVTPIKWIDKNRELQVIPPGRYSLPGTGLLTKEELYSKLGIPYYYYEWMKYLTYLLDLWEISRPKTKKVRELYLTTKEWYNKYEIEFPKSLESETNLVIETLVDLERTGIFEVLDLEIKEGLKIQDELEDSYHNWDKLNNFEKNKINIKLKTDDKKYIKNHPYYILMLEKVNRDKSINSE